VQIPFRITNYTCYGTQRQITVMLLPIVRLQYLNSIYAMYWHLTQQNTYVSKHLHPLHCHAPLYQSSVKVLWYTQQAICQKQEIPKSYDLRVKSKLVCECRNCSLLWLQILNFNVPRHSVISVTTNSHQSVFATSLCWTLANFHIDLCMFCLIRNERNVLNSVMDI